MKTATLPPLRVEPKLRRSMKAVLRKGETISAFVEEAVRTSIDRRRAAAEFLARGIAAGRASDEANDWIPASAVFAKLERRLARARRQR